MAPGVVKDDANGMDKVVLKSAKVIVIQWARGRRRSRPRRSLIWPSRQSTGFPALPPAPGCLCRGVPARGPCHLLQDGVWQGEVDGARWRSAPTVAARPRMHAPPAAPRRPLASHPPQDVMFVSKSAIFKPPKAIRCAGRRGAADRQNAPQQTPCFAALSASAAPPPLADLIVHPPYPTVRPAAAACPCASRSSGSWGRWGSTALRAAARLKSPSAATPASRW